LGFQGRDEKDIDFWIVRENNEGDYSCVAGRFNEGRASNGRSYLTACSGHR